MRHRRAFPPRIPVGDGSLLRSVGGRQRRGERRAWFTWPPRCTITLASSSRRITANSSAARLASSSRASPSVPGSGSPSCPFSALPGVDRGGSSVHRVVGGGQRHLFDSYYEGETLVLQVPCWELHMTIPLYGNSNLQHATSETEALAVGPIAHGWSSAETAMNADLAEVAECDSTAVDLCCNLQPETCYTPGPHRGGDHDVTAVSTVEQRRLARTLRRLREGPHLTIEQVAENLEPSPSTISGSRRPR